MAFDGVTIACVISELKKELIGGRLYKIAQPENDELLLTIKQPTGQKRLLLSASASLPLIYLTVLSSKLTAMALADVLPAADLSTYYDERVMASLGGSA